MKIFKVATATSVKDLEDKLNDPPDDYHVHSWQETGYGHGWEFVIIYKLGGNT